MDFSQFLSDASGPAGSGGRRSILFASSELAPFSKTGGLGDVAAALPKALARLGNQVSVITPLYNHLDPEEMSLGRRLRKLSVPRRGRNQQQTEATVWEGRLDHGARVFFVQNEKHFGHEGIYGYEHEDVAASADRWAFFSRAVVEFIRQYSVPVEVLHLNDWHTALAPIYQEHYYDDELGDIPNLLTIHNLGYQGRFSPELFDETGLPRTYESDSELLHDGDLNYLEGGILHTDRLTTVSPTYAEEIQTREHGHGLHEVISERSDDLSGILNGVDYSVWSPSTDRHIPVRYDIDNLNGKRRNKAELQHKFDLAIRPAVPLLGFVSRLTDQKGLDILVPAIRSLLEDIDDPREGFQVVFLGTGDDEYERQLQELAEEYPDWVGVELAYDDELAHWFQAGCDMLLLPSRWEPCGLTQLYAMKYGTLPIAHKTGGLADTVVDVDDDKPNSTGFVFEHYDADTFAATIRRALNRYSNYRKWRPLMERAMKRDFSWSSAARSYRELYDTLLGADETDEDDKAAE